MNDELLLTQTDDIDNSEELPNTDEQGQGGESAEDNSNVDSDINEDEVQEDVEEDLPAKSEDIDTESDDTTEDDDSQEERRTEIPDDNKAWQKRVERAKRSIERDFLAEVNSLSEGVTIERKEIPQATRLWNLLKANPELTRQMQGMIDTAYKDNKLVDLKAYANNPLNTNVSRDSDATEDRMELYEAKLEMKFSDPVFKKYESAVMKWAEDNEFPIKTKRNLEVAYKAWKGENSETLMTQAEANAKKKAVARTKAKKDAKLVSKSVSPVRPKKIDYKTASDSDILKAEGLSLFKED